MAFCNEIQSAAARHRGRKELSDSLNIAFFGSSLLSAYWNGAATYYRGIFGHSTRWVTGSRFMNPMHSTGTAQGHRRAGLGEGSRLFGGR